MRIRSYNQYNNAPSNNIQIVSFAFWLTTPVSPRIAPKKKLGAIIQLEKKNSYYTVGISTIFRLYHCLIDEDKNKK